MTKSKYEDVLEGLKRFWAKRGMTLKEGMDRDYERNQKLKKVNEQRRKRRKKKK